MQWVRSLAAFGLLAVTPAVVNAQADPLFLRADKSTLCTFDGTPTALRGVNLGGWLLMEGWQAPMDISGLPDEWSVRQTLIQRFGDKVADDLIKTYQDAWITDSDLDRIAKLGMNVVRLPFWYRNVESEEGEWRDDAFQRLDWLVTQAWKRGIYTIIDLHGVPGGQSDSPDTGRLRKPAVNGIKQDFWNNPKNLDRTDDIWRRVANHFRNNPAVAAYDLLNEPLGAPDRKTLWAEYDRLYQVVRAADPKHVITVEGAWGGTTDGKYTGWGWQQLPAPSASGWTNVLYQQHVYQYKGWNNYDLQTAATNEVVNGWLDRKAWNVPFIVGEFNCMGQGWAYTIDDYSSHDVSWIMWSYKSTHGTGSDSWGVYNPALPLPPIPNIREDSADAIKSKWARWTTDPSFTPNPLMQKVLAMPVPADRTYLVRKGKALVVKVPGILEGCTDLNTLGKAFEARLETNRLQGKLALANDGSFKYESPETVLDGEKFTYSVYDGHLKSVRRGTITIDLKVAGVQ